VNPETIIETALNDVFRYLKDANVDFSFSFNHDYKVNIDVLKTSRIFVNIIINGIQAMENKGTMWFRTSQSAKGNIQFTIGNSNSYIPPENIKKLFDSFFTSEKKGGTGLGLAIAMKVVESHGGEIWCSSSRDRGTEFHFTLPSLDLKADYDGELPKSAAEIRDVDTVASVAMVSDRNLLESENLFEQEIIRSKQSNDEPISILLVDDERLYLTVLRNQITSNADLGKHFSIREATSGEAAIDIATETTFDIIVMDVDMGKGNLNGFETVEKIRENSSTSTICIHSNRGGSQFHKKAIDSGADMFIGKTMPREHFLRMIYSTLGDPDELFDRQKEVTDSLRPVEVEKDKRNLILVEDNKVMRAVWERLCPKGNLRTFNDPEIFLSEYMTDADSFTGIHAIIIDNDFGKHSNKSGFDLARIIKRMSIGCSLVLSSSSDFSEDDYKDLFDLNVPKNPKEGIDAVYRFLDERHKSSDSPLESQEAPPEKLSHDALNSLISLDILATELKDSKFTEGTRLQIIEYADKLKSTTNNPAVDAIKGMVMEAPESLAAFIISLRCELKHGKISKRKPPENSSSEQFLLPEKSKSLQGNVR
jgi:CheY-like chemotaxis protein